MSPSWRDRLRIGLCPERLVLAGYRRGLRPRLACKEIVALSGADDAASWGNALAALPAALAHAAGRPTDVSVILSNHFVRYAVLPWNKALESAEDWCALARHRFAAIHGPAASDWELRVSQSAPRGARVACAVPAALLAGIEKTVGAAGARLVSVQPHLMAAFNRVRRRIGRTPCWLAVEEPGCLVLALIDQGDWQAIRSRRIDGDWRAQESEFLEREAALLTLPEPRPQVVLATNAAAQPEFAMALA